MITIKCLFSCNCFIFGCHWRRYI